MNAVPLVMREVQVAARRPTAHRVRMTASVIAMGGCFWLLLVIGDFQVRAAAGHWLFAKLGAAAFVGCAVAGLFLTADVISREKREHTLELLFLTDLRPYDVVFGKLAAKALLPLQGVIATVPALAVCVFLGGVTGGEFWRTACTLFNGLFFSLAVALFTSAICERPRSAHAAALLCLFACFGGIPLAAIAFARSMNLPLWERTLGLISPTSNYLLAGLAAIHILLKFWLAADASHAFTDDKRSGALESLLSAPIDARELGEGMLAGLVRRFWFPIAMLCAIDAALAVRFLTKYDALGATLLTGCAALFLFECYCAALVGLFRGLADQNFFAP